MRRALAGIAVMVALVVAPSVFATSASAHPTLSKCFDLAVRANWFFGKGAGTNWSRDPYPWGGCVSTIQQNLNAADAWRRNRGYVHWGQIGIDGIFGNQTTWAMHAYEKFVEGYSYTDGAAGARDLYHMHLWCMNNVHNTACVSHH